MSIVKEQAQKLANKLSDEVTWDDIMYEIYVRKKIDEGLQAADEGRLISHKEVKKRYLNK